MERNEMEEERNHDDEEASMAASEISQERSSLTPSQEESERVKESLLCCTCQSDKTEVPGNGADFYLYCQSCQSVSKLQTLEMASSTNQGEPLTVAGLPGLPDGSLQDSMPVEESSENTIPTGCFHVNSVEGPASVSPYQAAGGSQNVQIPVEGICDFGMSIEIPSKTTTTTVFILRQEQPNRPVALYSVCCTPSHMAKQVLGRIRERRAVELCAFTDEHAGSLGPVYFFHLSIHNQLAVSFELTNDCHWKFIATYPDQLNEQVISLHSIQSEAHNRIGLPGAKANVFLECVGRLHKVHQAHVRVFIRNDDGRHTLVFPIWG